MLREDEINLSCANADKYANNKNKLIHVLSIEMHLNVEDKSNLKLFLMEKINAESFSLLH